MFYTLDFYLIFNKILSDPLKVFKTTNMWDMAEWCAEN